MTTENLMALHLSAMFTLDGNGRLRTVNEPWDQSNPAPLAFLGLPIEAPPLCRAWAGLPEQQASALQALADRGVRDPDAYAKILGPVSTTEELCLWRPKPTPAAPLPEGYRQIAGQNLAALDLGEFSWLTEELPQAEPCFAYFHQGSAVAVCRSVRKSQAHEAGVETSPLYRGRGIAPLLVTAWADAVESLGRTPLYSLEAGNQPSRRLAEKTGFAPYGKGFSFASLHL